MTDDELKRHMLLSLRFVDLRKPPARYAVHVNGGFVAWFNYFADAEMSLRIDGFEYFDSVARDEDSTWYRKRGNASLTECDWSYATIERVTTEAT